MIPGPLQGSLYSQLYLREDRKKGLFPRRPGVNVLASLDHWSHHEPSVCYKVLSWSPAESQASNQPTEPPGSHAHPGQGLRRHGSVAHTPWTEKHTTFLDKQQILASKNSLGSQTDLSSSLRLAHLYAV